MFNQHNCNPLFENSVDQSRQPLSLPGIESSSRLIQQQHFWVSGQRPRHLKQLLFPQWQITSQLRCSVLQPDECEMLHRVFPDLSLFPTHSWQSKAGADNSGSTLDMPSHHHIFQNSHATKHFNVLKGAGYTQPSDLSSLATFNGNTIQGNSSTIWG